MKIQIPINRRGAISALIGDLVLIAGLARLALGLNSPVPVLLLLAPFALTLLYMTRWFYVRYTMDEQGVLLRFPLYEKQIPWSAFQEISIVADNEIPGCELLCLDQGADKSLLSQKRSLRDLRSWYPYRFQIFLLRSHDSELEKKQRRKTTPLLEKDEFLALMEYCGIPMEGGSFRRESPEPDIAALTAQDGDSVRIPMEPEQKRVMKVLLLILGAMELSPGLKLVTGALRHSISKSEIWIYAAVMLLLLAAVLMLWLSCSETGISREGVTKYGAFGRIKLYTLPWRDISFIGTAVVMDSASRLPGRALFCAVQTPRKKYGNSQYYEQPKGRFVTIPDTPKNRAILTHFSGRQIEDLI